MNETDTKIARIEGKLDRGIANLIPVSRGGSVGFKSMGEVMEMAKLMCVAQQAIPTHLREQPGLCLGVIMQAVAWEMEPFAVANKSFVVNDRLAYESQLVHAVIEARAPLSGRLRCTYAGEGDERTCTVFGKFKGEDEPHSYTTPKFAKIPVKNSPLWKWDVDQQLFYFASRAWARKWCPDVLLGVYTPDEAKYAGEFAADVSPPVEDMVDNPLGGDDEPEQGRVVSHEVGARMITEPEPKDGAVVNEDGSVTRQKPADVPKPKRAAKPRVAPKDAPAATPEAGQDISDAQLYPIALSEAEMAAVHAKAQVAASHPNDIPYPAKEDFIRWSGPDYVAYLTQWCNLAAVFDGEGFLRETYIRDRHKKEMAIRNQIGTPLTAVERERVNDICRAACKGIEQEAPDGTEG